MAAWAAKVAIITYWAGTYSERSAPRSAHPGQMLTGRRRTPCLDTPPPEVLQRRRHRGIERRRCKGIQRRAPEGGRPLGRGLRPVFTPGAVVAPIGDQRRIKGVPVA